MTGTQPLRGEVAVVTGAGRGIGRSIAVGYARAGAHVVCVARTTTDLEQLVDEIRAAGGLATAVTADVTDEARVEAAFAVTDDLGRLDIAVLNAGGLPGRGPITGSALADWQATFDLNVTAAYLCARAAIPRMRAAGGGRMVVVGSGVGHRGQPAFAAYSCAKAAQWMLTKVLADEVRDHPISVNEIVPGPVETTVGAGQFDARRFADEWAKRPDDVVPLALLLASQPNHGPSGQSYSLLRRQV